MPIGDAIAEPLQVHQIVNNNINIFIIKYLFDLKFRNTSIKVLCFNIFTFLIQLNVYNYAIFYAQSNINKLYIIVLKCIYQEILNRLIKK